jgi:CRISPR/Cas system-associated exonuclease Cas4 (RecB family)
VAIGAFAHDQLNVSELDMKTTPWSYSSLTAYETCPRRYYLIRISKQVKDPPNESATHGNEVHKALEEYVAGTAPMPEKYAPYLPVADRIKAFPGKKLVEYKFGLTRALAPTTFFAKDVWVRGVLDVGLLGEKSVTVLDYKTGKRKPDSDQLRLFAGVALSVWPYAKRVQTGYIWLQTQQMDTQVFTPDDRAPIFQEFAARVHRMETSENGNDWPARPSGLCKNYCPVGRSNCEHCGR